MDARQVGGALLFSELVVDFGEEGGRALAGGLMVSRARSMPPPSHWFIFNSTARTNGRAVTLHD